MRSLKSLALAHGTSPEAAPSSGRTEKAAHLLSVAFDECVQRGEHIPALGRAGAPVYGSTSSSCFMSRVVRIGEVSNQIHAVAIPSAAMNRVCRTPSVVP